MDTASPSEARAVEDRSENPDVIPGWTRWFVRLFLTALVVCGIFGIEAWPLTGWRLFSHLRSEHVVSWQVSAVDGSGAETPIRFKDLGPGYLGAPFIVRDFASLLPLDRDNVCRAWAQTVLRLGRPVVAFRIYRVDQDLLPRAHGRTTRPPARMIEYECRLGAAEDTP